MIERTSNVSTTHRVTQEQLARVLAIDDAVHHKRPEVGKGLDGEPEALPGETNLVDVVAQVVLVYHGLLPLHAFQHGRQFRHTDA
jgi:hypothetical protein